MKDLPLTEQRRKLLQCLAGNQPINWVRPQLMSWGRRTGYVAPTYRDGGTVVDHLSYEITPAGRLMLKIDIEHSYNIHSRQLGRSPVKGMRGRIGTILHCQCGWNAETNEDPQEGGRTEVKAHHAVHLTSLWAELAPALESRNVGPSTCPLCQMTWIVTPARDCMIPSCGCFGSDASAANPDRPCEPCGLAHALVCDKMPRKARAR